MGQPSGEDVEHSVIPSFGSLAVRIGALAAVGVVVVLIVSLLPGLDEVRSRFGQARPGWLAVVALCALASTQSYVAALHGTLSRRPSWAASWSLGMAEQGSNVLLPTGGVGGPALGAVVMRRAGVPADFASARSAALFLLTSATSLVAVVIAGLLCGVGVLPSPVGWVGTLLPAAVAASAIAGAAALAHLPVADDVPERRLIARWGHRIGALLRDGVRESLGLLRAHDPLVIGGCVGYLAFDIAATAAAFAAFGGDAPTIGAFVLAYTLGQVGGLIPTPGGLGGTEGGLIGMFVLYGTSGAAATAAVLAYRVFQLGLPVVFGVVAFVRIGRRLADESRRAEVAARYEEGP